MGAIGLTTELPAAVAVRPAPAAKPKAPKFYHPELDVLRFVAFLSVFFCHGLPFHTPRSLHGAAEFLWQLLQAAREAGNFGVCLFFMLSSYLITELLRREYLQTNTIHLKAFYVRRSLRIWPLYFTVLLIAAVAGSLVPFFHMEVRNAKKKKKGSETTDRVRSIRRQLVHCRKPCWPERAKLAVEHFSRGAILYCLADDR